MNWNLDVEREDISNLWTTGSLSSVFPNIALVDTARTADREGSKRSNPIADDIDRLDGLPAHVETHCHVFANFDLARRPDTQQTLQKLESRSNRVEVRHTHPKSTILLD